MTTDNFCHMNEFLFQQQLPFGLMVDNVKDDLERFIPGKQVVS